MSTNLSHFIALPSAIEAPSCQVPIHDRYAVFQLTSVSFSSSSRYPRHITSLSFSFTNRPRPHLGVLGVLIAVLGVADRPVHPLPAVLTHYVLQLTAQVRRAAEWNDEQAPMLCLPRHNGTDVLCKQVTGDRDLASLQP